MLEKISAFIWGVPMIVLLLGTHIYLTFKTKFVQKNVFYAIRLSTKKDKHTDGAISPFAALCTSLAASIGTGNIVGVGMAVFMGGPGAVFWCWLTGIFGMATNYAEVFLASKYSVKTKNGIRGGAMYVLQRRLQKKNQAAAFAVCGVFVSVVMGCMIQVTSVSEVMCVSNKFIKITPAMLAMILTCVTAVVILGANAATARVCGILVPIMALFYMGGCVAILIINADCVLKSVTVILSAAFKPSAAVGGLCGTGIINAARYGTARGLFSNEAGLGSAPLASSAVDTDAERQALICSTSAFWDTVVMCALTGIVIVSSAIKYGGLNAGADGAVLCASAFEKWSGFGTFIIVFSTVIFAYSTILGWAFQGEVCFTYLFGENSAFVYRILVLISIAVSPFVNNDSVWYVSDILNAFMALPNLICVLSLTDELPKKRYFEKTNKNKKN